MGVRIPSWISSITNLVHFYLFVNKILQHLPPLNQLPFLKVVSLEGMEALEYISDDDSVSNVLGASSSSSSKTPFFPSLSYLDISECPKLKGWWRNEPHHLLLPSFLPSLSTLQIWNCLNLTSMPLIPDLISLKESEINGCPFLRLRRKQRRLSNKKKQFIQVCIDPSIFYNPKFKINYWFLYFEQLLKLFQLHSFQSFLFFLSINC